MTWFRIGFDDAIAAIEERAAERAEAFAAACRRAHAQGGLA